MITREYLKRSIPPALNADKSEHIVLAVLHNRSYVQTNTYIPHWDVLPARFYARNNRQYDGWISVADVLEREPLRTDLPGMDERPDGTVDCVLAQDVSGKIRVSNAVYYATHPAEFVGWIALEWVPLPANPPPGPYADA